MRTYISSDQLKQWLLVKVFHQCLHIRKLAVSKAELLPIPPYPRVAYTLDTSTQKKYMYDSEREKKRP